MTLDKKRVEQLALENGFKLKQQEDGTMALNAYVFEFADKLITETIGELAKVIGAGEDTLMLVEAVARIKDLMEADDGQAWKEARKFLDKLEKPAPAYKCPAPEGYVQPDEPEFGDGCDYEGFPGGCARMGCKPKENVQWWLASLDQYGNPSLVDGAHGDREGADRAAYLIAAMKLGPGKKYAVARVELSEPQPTAKGVDQEAVARHNRAAGSQG